MTVPEIWVSSFSGTLGSYLECMAKNFILKKEVIIEKISYERHAYESVNESSHP